MVCTCERDGVREVEDRRLKIFRHMRLHEMGSLTQAIVLSLAFDFECDAEVDVDQWFGIFLKTPLLNEGVFIPCDGPQDGFAAAWEMLDQRFPGRASVSEMKGKPQALCGEDRAAVAQRISAKLFQIYDEFAVAYRKHRDEAHQDSNDCPPCEDCEVLLSLRVSAHHALDGEWGSQDLDTCIQAVFER